MTSTRRGDGRPHAAPPARIWTRTFALFSLAEVLGYGHQGLLTPVIPLFVTSLGYSDTAAGLVLAAFSVTSFIMRPVAGYFADTWSVRGVVAIGALLLAGAGAAMTVPIVWTIALANAVRGIGWGVFNTAANTLVAHLAPPGQRGAVSSYVYLFQNVMTALSPPLALWIVTGGGNQGPTTQGFLAVFGLGSVAGVLASVATVPMDPARTQPPPVTAEPGGSAVSRFYDRGVFLASMLLFLLILVYQPFIAFAPLYARSIGIEIQSVGWYYVAIGVTTILGRPLVGSLSDRFGRGPMLAAGYGMLVLALLVMASARTLPVFVSAAALFAGGLSLHQPASLALAMDRANPRRRGAAMASYSLWFQVGNGIGSAYAGAMADRAGYPTMYLLALAAPIAGLMVVAANWRSLGRSAAQPAA